MRYRPRGLALRLMQYSPARRAKGAIANITILSMCTISFALNAELIATDRQNPADYYLGFGVEYL